MSFEEPTEAERRALFRVFFFAVFAFLLYQLLRVLSPFLSALLWAWVLALIFWPLHERLLRKTGSPHLAASLSTGAVLFAAVLPLGVLSWSFARESEQLYPAARAWAEALRQAPQAASLDPFLPQAFQVPWGAARSAAARLGLDLQDLALGQLHVLGEAASGWGAQVARNLVFLGLNLFFLFFALFFIFLDGKAFSHWLMDLVPMEKAHKEHIGQRFYEAVTAVVRGVTITAAAQGLLAGLGYALAGVPFPVFLGLATAFAAMLPIVGPALVWAPVAAAAAGRSAGAAIFLAAWGLLAVSLLDNTLRPLLIGEKARLPFAFVFFSVLGGVRVYGVLGLALGPALLAVLLAFARIYREEFRRRP